MEKHEKQKTKKSFDLFIPFPKGLKKSSLSQGSRDTRQTIIWPVHTFSQRSENKFPFPRLQGHQANNHLACSYLFPKVWKQVPFPKVPETPSKQLFELFIPFPKGLKKGTLSQGSRDTKQTIIWTVHALSQGPKSCWYPFPRVAPAAWAASAPNPRPCLALSSPLVFYCFLFWIRFSLVQM